MNKKSPAEVFDGFRISRENMARGGSGVVHEAVSPDGRKVALKVLNRAKIEGKAGARDNHFYEKYVKRFKAEYQTLVGLNHPNIAKVLKIGFFNDQYYIASEFIDGKALAEFVRGLSPQDMIPFFVQVLDGLDYIHRSGLVHLDIKSENILVMEDKTQKGQNCEGQCSNRVKIIDFGIAMQRDEYGGEFIGSVSTMAPEVVLGRKEDVDSRADLFSFACVMYQCITGVDTPFARSKKMDIASLRRAILRETLPRGPSLIHSAKRPEYVCSFLDDIILRLLAHEPKDRYYGNARAVANALITRMPGAFVDTLTSRAAYLIPEGNKHIGRSEEQKNLLNSLENLFSGKSSAYLIHGKAGMGKTHLLQRIKEQAERYIDKMIIAEISFPADDAVFDSWMAKIAKRQSENKVPLFLLADDLQDITDQQLKYIDGLCLAIEDANKRPEVYKGIQPVMVCMALKTPSAPDEKNFDSIFGKSFVNIVPLFPFGRHEIRTYLESTPAFNGLKISDNWVSSLATRTSGIPRELAEHLTNLDDNGLLFAPDGSIHISDSPTFKKLPTITRERLLKIYNDLPSSERELLNFLSVWYLQKVTRKLSLLDLENFFYASSLSQSIRELFLKGVLANENGSIVWQGNYFEDLVYESLPKKDRELIHDSIADYLKTDKDAVAFHRVFGSDPKSSVKNAVSLGRRMLFKYGMPQTARRVFEHSMNVARKDNIRLKAYLWGLVSDAYFYEGNLEESIGASETAMALISILSLGTHALQLSFFTKIATAHIQRKNYETAETVIMEALKLAGGKYLLHRMILENCLAAVLFYRAGISGPLSSELLAQALALSVKNLEEESRLTKDAKRRVNNNQLGSILFVKGRYDEAAAHLEMLLAKKEHSIYSSISINISLAENYRLLHDIGRAKEKANTAIRLALEIGQSEWLMHAHGILANLYYEEDDFDSAMAENRRYFALSSCISDTVRHRQIDIRYCIRMGHCLRDKGEHDKSVPYFTAAIEEGATGYDLMSAEQGLGEALHVQGEHESARLHFLKAEELLAAMPDDPVTRSHRERIAKFKL